MTRTSLAAVAFVLASSGAHAQETLPQTAPPAPGQQSGAISRDKLQRIYLIRQYETVLTNAVKTGIVPMISATVVPVVSFSE